MQIKADIKKADYLAAKKDIMDRRASGSYTFYCNSCVIAHVAMRDNPEFEDVTLGCYMGDAKDRNGKTYGIKVTREMTKVMKFFDGNFCNLEDAIEDAPELTLTIDLEERNEIGYN